MSPSLLPYVLYDRLFQCFPCFRLFPLIPSKPFIAVHCGALASIAKLVVLPVQSLFWNFSHPLGSPCSPRAWTSRASCEFRTFHFSRDLHFSHALHFSRASRAAHAFHASHNQYALVLVPLPVQPAQPALSSLRPFHVLLSCHAFTLLRFCAFAICWLRALELLCASALLHFYVLVISPSSRSTPSVISVRFVQTGKSTFQKRNICLQCIRSPVGNILQWKVARYASLCLHR